MAYDLTEIQTRMAYTLDQSTSPPTAGGNEWNLRMGFVNRAYEEWSGAYEWEVLRTPYWAGITGVSQASVTLPTGFRKMASFPLNYSTGVTGGEQWPEILPHETKLYDTSDDYFYILGYRGSFTMVWNPGTLASGASLYLEYYKYPTSLASPADVPVIQDIEFLVDRAIAYVFETRSDARFQEVEAKARDKLLQLIDNENTRSKMYENAIITPERKQSFRFGRD